MKQTKQQISFNLAKPLYKSDTQQEADTLKFGSVKEGVCTKGPFVKVPEEYRRPTRNSTVTWS